MLWIFIPFFLFDLLVKNRFVYWLRMAFMLGMSVLLIGIVFKILHWQGANMMLMVPMLSIALLYLIDMFIYRRDSLKELVHDLFMAALSVGTLFRMLHWLHGDRIVAFAGVLLIVWLIMEIKESIDKRKLTRK